MTAAKPDFHRAMLLLDEGDFVTARGMLDDLVRQAPHAAAPRVLLARAAEGEQDMEDACRHWQQAARLCPGSPVVREGLRMAVLRREYGAQAVSKSGAGSAPAAGASGSTHPSGAAAPEDPSAAGFADLNRLIEELETARIVPDPDIQPLTEEELAEAEAANEPEEVVSETLARIYANQAYYLDAAAVYEKLAVKHPDRAEDFSRKAAEMREKATGNA